MTAALSADSSERKFARWVVLVVLASICAMLDARVACAADGERILRLGMQLEPPVLDPTANPAAAIGEIMVGNVYEGLVRFDGESVVPALAASWEISSDGREIVFHLRDGVRFHDGTPFDASVAKFALERARGADSSNPQRSRLAAISGIDTPAPNTLRLVLAQPASSLLPSLAWAAFVMVSPSSVAQNATHPVGTGPFKFAAWRRGDSLSLVRNENYWGTPAHLNGAVFRFIAEPAAAYAALMAGDIDAYPNYPAPESVAQFKADSRFGVFVGSTEGETILALNERKAPFDRIEVRRAVSYALDRAAIIKGAMFGFGTPIGSHFPPQSKYAVDLTGMYPHDVVRAKELLAAAHFEQGVPLRLALPPPSYARRSGEIVAAELGAVGIRVRIENLEWAQWLDQVFARHDFDMTIVQHAEPADYDIYGRDDYYFGYSSAAFKGLLGQLETNTDEAARGATLALIQRKLASDAVNGFIFQYPKLSVFDARVQGLAFSNPLNSVDLRGVRLSISREEVSKTGGAARAVGLGAAAFLAGLLLLVAVRAGLPAVARRFAILLLTLAVASAVIFAVVQVAPGDPARFMLGLQADDAHVALLRHALGLDGSPLHRYLEWIRGMVRGDFGMSYTYRVPVGSLIAERLQVSLPLAVYALVLTVLIAFPLGLASAAFRGRSVDSLIAGGTQLGIAVPNFWLGIVLILIFAIGLRWVSAGGFAGWDAGLWPAFRSLTLPAVALAIPQAAILARVLRSALIDTLHEDFVRTARAKGLSKFAALRRHALPNAMIAVMTVVGLQFSFLLAGAVVIENVFFLPGVGRLVLLAIEQRDLIVVQSVVLLLCAAVILVSFVVDLSYAWIDPRLRTRRA